MKAFVIFSIALTILSVSCEKVEEKQPKDGTTYTTKYDNLDLDEILKSDRLLLNYVNCLLDKAHCSPDADELKSKIQFFLYKSGIFCRVRKLLFKFSRKLT